MKLNDMIYGLLNEASDEIKKEKNMKVIKEKIINPVIKEILDELSPYFIKIVITVISLILILLITIILNIKVILKN
tara:strand:- start:554 stop:781 length:228 start_codon:yes stop_codon:yes gene_type:complete